MVKQDFVIFELKLSFDGMFYIAADLRADQALRTDTAKTRGICLLPYLKNVESHRHF